MRGKGPLLGLLAATRFVAFAGRMGMVPFIPELMTAYGAGYTAMGALYSSFFAGYALCLVPAGWASDRWGARPVLAAGLVMSGLAQAGFALAPSYGIALAGRVAVGVGVAFVYAPVLKLLAEAFGRAERGRASSVLEMAIGATLVVVLSGFPLLARIAQPRWLLLGAALAAFALLPWLMRLRVRSPEAVAAERAAPVPAAPVPAAGTPAAGRGFFAMLAVGFLGLLVAGGVLGWLPTYLEQGVGLAKPAAGAVMGVLLASQLAAAYPAGIVSDRLGRRVPAIDLGTALMGAAALGFALGPGGWEVWLAAAVFGAGTAAGISQLVTLSAEYGAASRSGLITSATTAVGQLGSALAGVLVGAVVDLTGGFRAAWWVLLAAAALRLWLARFIPEGEPAAEPVSAPGSGPARTARRGTAPGGRGRAAPGGGSGTA